LPLIRPRFLLLFAILLAAVAALLLVVNRRFDTQLAASAEEPPLAGDTASEDRTPFEPNYTLIEPGLYVGGYVTAPPPDARAVLCLSLIKDDYTAPIHEWQPIPDEAPAPSLEWLRKQVAFIDTQRRAGHTVFVHCEAGVSRSGLVAAAYFMWRNHWPRDRALAFLRTTRPIVNPNPAFMDLLSVWEHDLADQSAPAVAPSSATTRPL
jgi:hypothetical protein